MKDIRTPDTYFQPKGASPEAMKKLKDKLEDLIGALENLRQRAHTTPATEKIIDDELTQLNRQKYRSQSRKQALRILDAFCYGYQEDVDLAIKEALDFKAHHRVQPFLENTGSVTEEQVFWSDLVGRK